VLPRLIRHARQASPAASMVLCLAVQRDPGAPGCLVPGSHRGRSFRSSAVTRALRLGGGRRRCARPAHRSAPRPGPRATTGSAVRLEVVCRLLGLSGGLSAGAVLPLTAHSLFRVHGPVNLVRLTPGDRPGEPARFVLCALTAGAARPDAGHRSPFLSSSSKADMLIHQPFESFDGVLAFLRESVNDPARAGHQADDLPHGRRTPS